LNQDSKFEAPGIESAAFPEIAYDVGFQSLTQFNRTFKRVFRRSPSDFRARLASSKRTGKAA
jgi:AraC-like DNA-binding protein